MTTTRHSQHIDFIETPLSHEEAMRDCFLSWEAAIAELRRRHEAGEPVARQWREAEARKRNHDTRT